MQVHEGLLKEFKMEYEYDYRSGERMIGNVTLWDNDTSSYQSLRDMMGKLTDIHFEKINKTVRNVIINHVSFRHCYGDYMAANLDYTISFTFYVIGLKDHTPELELLK